MRIAICSPILRDDMLARLKDIPGLEAYGCEPADLARAAHEADGLVLLGMHYDAALADALAAPEARVRWMQLLTAGYETLEAFGVPAHCAVSNAGDVWSASVAEHVMALTLALMRRFPETAEAQVAAQWNAGLRVRVRSLYGARLLVVGMGSIGREVASRAHAFGMWVGGVNRSGRPVEGADAIYPASRLHEALGQADIVVIAAPSGPETRGLIGQAELAACRPGAMLINVARGDLIDSAALIAALDAGHLGGAGLDVTEPEPLPPGDPLWRRRDVMITPHIGGAASPAYMMRLSEHVARNIVAFASGDTPTHLVKIQNVGASRV